MRLRLALLAVSLVSLAVPAAGLAANPIPGATYSGTTDTGSPFSFKVSPDGASITDITTSAALTCVGPEGGVEVMAIVSTVPIPVAGGQINGKDETPTPRLDSVTGTFTSAAEVTGKIEAVYSKFKLGEGVTSCRRDVLFTARSGAATPAGSGSAPPPAATAPAAGVPAGTPSAAAVTLAGPSGAKLLTALSRGFALKGTVAAPARLTATAKLAPADAKRYGTKVFATKTANVAGGAYSLTLKPAKSTARKLRKARRLKLAVTVVSTTAAGATSTTKRTVTLQR